MLAASRLKKKRILSLLFGSFLLVNAVFLLAGYYFYDVIIKYSKSNAYSAEDYIKEAEELGYDYSALAAAKKEYYSLDSEFGYSIKGIFVRNPKITNKTMVLVHGIGRNKEWSLMKYGNLFLENGFNLFAYDSRNHGETGGDFPSYGFYEHNDLQTCLAYIKHKSEKGILGIHGESMGASTVLMWAAEYNDPCVSFVIEDCGYSDLYELFYDRLDDYSVPKILRPVLLGYTNAICQLISKFSFADVSPLAGINQVKLPVLFIHGNNDDFVKPDMAMVMFNQKVGAKKLYLVPKAEHAKSINMNMKKYEEVFLDFYKEVTEK